MKLKEKGRYLELPISGLKIKKLIFDGFLTVVFDDQEESYLEFHSALKVMQYNQTMDLYPNNKDTLMLFYDHFSQTIKEAKADKKGNLWVRFENGTEIAVEDGPYENWHYTKKSLINQLDSLSVHGGVGRTIY